jgi:hypothetical protein
MEKEKTIYDSLEGTPITVFEATNLPYAKIVSVEDEISEKFTERATKAAKTDTYLVVRAKRKDDERKFRLGSVKLRPDDRLTSAEAFGIKYTDWAGKYCSFFIQTFKGKEYVRAKPRPDLPPKGNKEPAPETKKEEPVEAQL